VHCLDRVVLKYELQYFATVLTLKPYYLAGLWVALHKAPSPYSARLYTVLSWIHLSYTTLRSGRRKCLIRGRRPERHEALAPAASMALTSENLATSRRSRRGTYARLNRLRLRLRAGGALGLGLGLGLRLGL
jgi:hypothetical protein